MDVEGSKGIFFRRFIYGLQREDFAWSSVACGVSALYARACCGLFRMPQNYRRKVFLPLIID